METNKSQQPYTALLSFLTFKVDGCGAGAALAGCGLDRVGGVIARARCPGYGTPFGDNGPLTKGNDRVLVFQAPVVIQVQPPLPDTTTTNAAASTSVTVQLLHEKNNVRKRARTSIHCHKIC